MKYQFKLEPWSHQRGALLDSWDKAYWALLLCYGAGKTKIILDTAGILWEIKKDIQALFVIAPNEVHTQWVDEQVPEHLPDRIPRICRAWSTNTSKKYKRTLEDFWETKNDNKLRIFTMNVESLQSSPRAQAFAKNFLNEFRSLLVVDEATRIKTPGTKRTRFIVGQLSKLAPYRRNLTGNEITRSPFDVYSQYRFLHNDFWSPIPNHHTFKHRYGKWKTNFRFRKSVKLSKKGMSCPHCSVLQHDISIKRTGGLALATCPSCNMVLKNNQLPKNAQKILSDGGKSEYPTLLEYKNLEELRAKTQACSTLVRKEDLDKQLPPKIYSPIYTELNDEQIRLYTELKNTLHTEYKGTELTVANKVALTTRFQQIVGGYFPDTEEQIGDYNPKLNRLTQELMDIDIDDPIIIWARFTAEIRGIEQALKKEFPEKRTVTFYGKTERETRRRYKQEFKDGKINFFVANPSVAGTGLNLQRAYIQFYYSNSFNSEDRWQSEDRTHRGEQRRNCIYKDIFIKGTVDDTIKEANEKKVALAEFFKDRSIQELV